MKRISLVTSTTVINQDGKAVKTEETTLEYDDPYDADRLAHLIQPVPPLIGITGVDFSFPRYQPYPALPSASGVIIEHGEPLTGRTAMPPDLDE